MKDRKVDEKKVTIIAICSFIIASGIGVIIGFMLYAATPAGFSNSAVTRVQDGVIVGEHIEITVKMKEGTSLHI